MVRGGGGGVGKPLKHKIRLDMKNLGPAPPLVLGDDQDIRLPSRVVDKNYRAVQGGRT